VKNFKDKFLEALREGTLTPIELATRLRLPLHYVRYELSMLEEEGLVEYDLATEKWRISRK